ncbi:MAG: hypothetical protein H6561_15730 [Lewinellaceae bacterium]|nr:hypothetical protein [Saprospiraceae bacterium]MCB9270998.1 hypothetical protein [Lewinellaceae bacterium]HQU54143.1 hypothetical protein [Saprospiraceae bacterium]
MIKSILGYVVEHIPAQPIKLILAIELKVERILKDNLSVAESNLDI